MCETLINFRVIAALVASAALAIGIPNRLVAADPTGDGSQLPSLVAVQQSESMISAPLQDALKPPAGEAPVAGVPQAGPAPQQPPALEPTQLLRPEVIQPARVRRIVRRGSPANATQPFRRIRPQAPPSDNFSLLGVGFGF
jgi:hypothetical protein